MGSYGGERKIQVRGAVNEVNGVVKRRRRLGKELRGENNMLLVKAVKQPCQEL